MATSMPAQPEGGRSGREEARAGPGGAGRPAFLVFDTSYTLEMIRERGIEDSVTCRDLDGFFRKVWTVHPFATMLTSEEWSPRFGVARHHVISDRHVFIEGTVGRFRWLRRAFPLNFLASQISLFLTLWRLIRREKIAVIRVGETMYGGLFGWALSRLNGIPLVVRLSANYEEIRAMHGPIFPALFRTVKIERAIEKFVLRRADLVAGPNQDNAEFAIRSGTPPERVTIFRYGNLIAREHLVPPEQRTGEVPEFAELGIGRNRYLICVGRLEPVKFPDHAVRVLGRLAEAGLEYRLVLVGDGSMREELEALAISLGVGDRLVFAGNRNQKALARLLPNAAIVLSPLTGRALTEAAFAGTPIVAYDADWQGELVETGISGELVPNLDWEAMARSTETLLRDPAYAARMGRGVRERALAMLSPDVLNAHERSEYCKLLGLPAAG